MNLFLSSSDPEVQNKAIKNFTTKSAINIVKNDSDSYIRRRFLDAVDDENVLINIACNDSDASVRKKAVEKINNEDILIDIARNDSDLIIVEPIVKKIGVENINDQTILAKFVKNGVNWQKIDSDREHPIYIAALNKINDESLLRYVADYNWGSAVGPYSNQTKFSNRAKEILKNLGYK